MQYNKRPMVMDQFSLFGIPPKVKKKKKRTFIFNHISIWIIIMTKLDFFFLIEGASAASHQEIL